MGQTVLLPFRPNQQLTASDLNAAFKSTWEQISISAGAPRSPGLFRPTVLRPDIPLNRFTLEGDSLLIEWLCVVLPSGYVVVDRHARLERLHLMHSAYLTADGELRDALTVPDDGFPLVRRTGPTSFETVARISTLDADMELSALFSASWLAAGDWRDALHRAGSAADESLADVADATALNNELDTSRQCISLVRLSRALSRRMATKSLTDARLETAAAGPKTSSRTDLSDWLQGVVEVLSDEALRAAFLGTGGWRPPDSIRLGETLAGGLREVLFDLKDMPGMEVEVASPDGFANSRWRLGEAGREHAFLGTRQVENSWRAYLVLSEGDPRALFVWTDTVRPQDLRVRLIAGGGTVTA